MLFTRYNVLLFRSTGEPWGNFHLRGWILPVCGILFLLLVAGNVVLWNHFLPYAEYRRQLERNLDVSNLQVAVAYDAAFDIFALQKEFASIDDLSSKLKVMLNLDAGGDTSEDADRGLGGRTILGANGKAGIFRQAHDTYRRLMAALRVEEVEQQQLMRELVSQRENLTRIPSIWPTRGRFTSPFGYRRNPVTRRVAFHKGIDISAPTGTPIRATAAGSVTFAKWFSTYGNTVEITHGNGLKTRFGHLSKIRVKEGQKLKRGDVIGDVGSTGRSISPHLHYEVHKDGRPVNPLFYIMDG